MNHKKQKIQPSLILAIMVGLLFSALFSVHSLARHYSFHSVAFDLGVYSQATYLYTQTIFPISSIHHQPVISDHFEPILAIFSILYQFFPSASTLLVLQSISVGLSIMVIYKLAFNKTASTLTSAIISIIYATSIGITAAISFDFHTSTIAVLPLSLAIYFWSKNKTLPYIISLFILFITKEEFIIIFGLLGLSQLIKRDYQYAKISILFAIAQFVLVFGLVFPLISILYNEKAYGLIRLTSTNQYATQLFPDTFGNIVKMQTFISLYIQYLFLPLLNLTSGIVVIGYLLLRFFSSYQALWTTYFHHNAIVEVFLAFGMIQVIPKINNLFYRRAVLGICSLLTIYQLTRFTATTAYFISIISEKNYIHQSLKENASRLNSNTAISATTEIVPHISNRSNIYIFPNIQDAKIVIIDSSLLSANINIDDNLGGLTTQSFRDHEEKLLANGWHLVYQKQTLKIYSKPNS